MGKITTQIKARTKKPGTLQVPHPDGATSNVKQKKMNTARQLITPELDTAEEDLSNLPNLTTDETTQDLMAATVPGSEPPPVPEFLEGIECNSTFLKVGKRVMALRRHYQLGFRKLDPKDAIDMFNEYPKRFVELQYQVCIYRYESESGEVFDTDFYGDLTSATAGLKEYFESLAAQGKLRKTRLILAFSDGLSHTIEFIAGGEYDGYTHNVHVMILTDILESRDYVKLESEKAYFNNLAWRMKLLGIDSWKKSTLTEAATTTS